MATIKVDGVEIEYDPTPAEITTHVDSEDGSERDDVR